MHGGILIRAHRLKGGAQLSFARGSYSVVVLPFRNAERETPGLRLRGTSGGSRQRIFRRAFPTAFHMEVVTQQCRTVPDSPRGRIFRLQRKRKGINNGLYARHFLASTCLVRASLFHGSASRQMRPGMFFMCGSEGIVPCGGGDKLFFDIRDLHAGGLHALARGRHVLVYTFNFSRLASL